MQKEAFMFGHRRAFTFVEPLGASDRIAFVQPAIASMKKAKGFTLVELLVVIGIISVLIAILLPTLNKARQSGTYIACQSNLREMGQALMMYVDENKGLLPWGANDSGESWESGPPPSNEYSWFWTFTLSQYMNKNLLGSDGLVHNLSRTFQDGDTIQDATSAPYINHYTCNPRLFPNNDDGDYAANTFSSGSVPEFAPGDPRIHPPKIASVKPSTVFLFWDAPQCRDYPIVAGNGAYEIASELDGNELTFGTAFILGSPDTAVNYNRPVSPGNISQSQSATVCATLQKTWNIDTLSSYPPIDATESQPNIFNTQIRFRHLGNTTLNALCLDGHVESRLKGQFMVTDICTNYPQQ
jgi:prepilin-type N-terminal cleavage/methylation domain-containing protein